MLDFDQAGLDVLGTLEHGKFGFRTGGERGAEHRSAAGLWQATTRRQKVERSFDQDS
jgi:hypothetical protein